MHKNSQHSARDSEIVRVSVSLPIAATLYLLTRTEIRSPTTILSEGASHVSHAECIASWVLREYIGSKALLMIKRSPCRSTSTSAV